MFQQQNLMNTCSFIIQRCSLGIFESRTTISLLTANSFSTFRPTSEHQLTIRAQALLDHHCLRPEHLQMAHILDLRPQQEHSHRRHCIPIVPPAPQRDHLPTLRALHLQLMALQMLDPQGPLDLAHSKTRKEDCPAAGKGVKITSDEHTTWTITRGKLPG